MKKQYTSGEAAKVIGCDPQTLRKACNEDRVEFTKVGSFRVFSEKEVQRLKELYQNGKTFKRKTPKGSGGRAAKSQTAKK